MSKYINIYTLMKTLKETYIFHYYNIRMNFDYDIHKDPIYIDCDLNAYYVHKGFYIFLQKQ